MERRAADRAAVPQSALNRAVGLVLLAAISPQVGAAFAVKVFDELGPAGAAFGRLLFAAIILVALWRPRIKAQPIRVAIVFGLALGAMNLCIYEAAGWRPDGQVKERVWNGAPLKELRYRKAL